MATERFIRWFQYRAFTPMFRVHGAHSAPEPWHFPAASQPVLADYVNLRYRLLPYIRSLASKVAREGYTMMRPLVMDFRGAATRGIGDQFMFGPAFLVNPVSVPGVTSRRVYLPAGVTWLDFWTGAGHAGGLHIHVPAPVRIMPLFVRAGSIIPYGPPAMPRARGADAALELRVYPGANGRFDLHEVEDDAQGGPGASITIPFTWNNGTRVLKIGALEGMPPGGFRPRVFSIVFVRPRHGVGIPASDAPDQIVTYTGAALKIRQAPPPARPDAPPDKPVDDFPIPGDATVPGDLVSLGHAHSPL